MAIKNISILYLDTEVFLVSFVQFYETALQFFSIFYNNRLDNKKVTNGISPLSYLISLPLKILHFPSLKYMMYGFFQASNLVLEQYRN